MTVSRRQMLKVTAVSAISSLSLLGGHSFAQKNSPRRKTARIDVVKVVSFGCPVSRASEHLDARIQEELRRYGGKFVFSPFPAEADAKDDNSGARERVYFASRAFGPFAEQKIRTSLFKGVQDMGLPLNDYMQVFTWLSRDVPELSTKYADIFRQAQEDKARESLSKTAYLAQMSGASALPGYIILVNGEVKTVIGPDDVPGGALPKVRDLVISTIHKYGDSE